MLKNFCPLPFGHTVISTNGTFGICCSHFPPAEHKININYNNFSVWTNSQYVKDVQNSFQQDQQHSGCRRCWNQENAGRHSLRQQILNEYKILKITEPVPISNPVNIEIQLGNLCNLKCLMCNEAESSAILSENKKLKINTTNQTDYQWTDIGFKNLEELLSSGPKIINIRGGEPFYNKKLLDLVTKLSASDCSNTILHVTTNATTWNSKWKDALSKFKLVRIMASIDATDKLYEYMRYPASWDQVVKNIKSFQQIKNFKLVIHGVVQNLNIGNIGSLIQWTQQENLYLHLAQLTGPSHLIITNLPTELKAEAIKHLETILANNCPEHLIPYIKSWHAQLLHALTQEFDHGLWIDFQKSIQMRDNIRNNSHRDFLKYQD